MSFADSLNNALKDFYRPPNMERVGDKVMVGLNTMTATQAKEAATKLMELAQEAEVAEQEKKARAQGADFLLFGSRAALPPLPKQQLVIPSKSDVKAYGTVAKTEPESPAGARRGGSPIVIGNKVLSPKPPKKLASVG